MSAGLPGDQLLAAIIVGASTLTAAAIKAFVLLRVGQRPGRAHRTGWSGAATWLVAGGLLAAIVVLAGGAGRVETVFARLGPAGVWSGGGTAPGDHATGLQTWLFVEGTTLYYHHEPYLDARCQGTVAVGNWARGRGEPVPARCLDDGWLALDFAPLLASGRMVRNLTYCVNFRRADDWGRHAVLGAPGFDAVAVPATSIPLGRAIGFRIIRLTPVDRLVLGDSFPRASC